MYNDKEIGETIKELVLEYMLEDKDIRKIIRVKLDKTHLVEDKAADVDPPPDLLLNGQRIDKHLHDGIGEVLSWIVGVEVQIGLKIANII